MSARLLFYLRAIWKLFLDAERETENLAMEIFFMNNHAFPSRLSNIHVTVVWVFHDQKYTLKSTLMALRRYNHQAIAVLFGDHCFETTGTSHLVYKT